MKKVLIFLIFVVFSIIELQSQTCFTTNWTGNGLEHMNIYVTKATVNGVNMIPGDEIGVFDGNDCVGVGVLIEELTGGAIYLQIRASWDDPETPIKDGFTIGNPISFRQCINGGTQIITNVTANFTTGNGLFSTRGTAVVELSGINECSNPPTLTLGSTSGSTCETTSVTVTGNQFGGSAENVSITTNGTGSVTPVTTGSSPFSFTYTPAVADIGNTVTITLTTDNPLGSPCAAATATYTLSVNAIPTITSTTPSSRCGTGTVTLGATASIGTVNWYDSSTEGNLLGTGTTFTTPSISSTTNYYVGATNNGCPTATRTEVTATVNPLPATPTAVSGSNADCDQFTANWQAADHATSYRLDVSVSNTFSSFVTGYQDRNVGNVTSFDVTGLTAGTTYYYRVRAVNSCGVSLNSGTITYATSPPAPGQPGLITGETEQCPAQSGQIYSVAEVTNATSYLWSVPTGWTINSGQGTRTISVTTGSAGQNGDISVIASNSCGSSAARTLAVTVNPLPAQPGDFTTSTATVCQGATSVVYTVPNDPTVTYNWSYGGTGATINGTGNSITINYSTSATSGTLSVTATNSCGTSDPRTLAIAVNPLPTQPGAFTTSTATVCQGATGVVYTVPNDPSVTYNWTYSGSGATITGSTNSVTINYSNTATSGTLSVTASNSCGTSAARTLAITVNPLPAAAGTITGTATVCQGTAGVSYSVPAIANASSYEWVYTGTGATINGNTNSITIDFGTTATSGNLTVRGVNGCGNGTTSANYAITVNPLPAAAGTITGTSTVCQGVTGVAYSVPAIANASSYIWSYSGTGATISGTTNNITINFAANATSGNLTVRGSNGCGNGTVSANYAITVNPLPTQPGAFTTSTATVCQGATGVVYTVPNDPSVTYNWTYSGTGATITGSTNSVTINYSNTATSGILSVTASNSCGTSAARTLAITVNQLPTANAGAALAAICQGGTSAPLGGSVGGSATGGTWSSSAGGTFIPNATTLNATWQPPAAYSGTATLTLTTSGGSCGADTDSKTLVVNPNATITLTSGSSTQTLCQGNSITNIVYSIGGGGTGAGITGLPAGVTGVYSGGLFTISGTPSVTGTFNYTVTTTGTCTQTSANGTITVNPNATITLTSGSSTQTVCMGSAITNIVYTIGGGGTGAGVTGLPAGVTGSYSGGQFTISGTPTVAGTFPFTVTTTGTCTQASAGGTITSVSVAAPTVGAITQPTCDVSTGSVVLSGLPSGTWTINPGSITGSTTSRTITGLTSGSYNFTVTNSIGCVSPPSETVTINPQPATPTAPVVESITQPSCNVSTGSVILTGLPATGTWTLTRSPGGTTTTGSGTSTTITGLTSATTYTFTVRNEDGCTSPSSNNVVINAQPPTPSAPVIGSIIQPTCTEATGSITITGLPSSGTWTLIQYPGGATTSGSGTSITLSGIPPGIYNYSVTNSFGCTSVVSDNATVNAQPPTPTAPTVGTITHPTCTESTGSVVLNNLPSGSWTITRSPGGNTYTGSTTSYTVTGLASESYTFTVTNSFGCTSPSSSNVVINVPPPIPAAPVIGSITHPTCTEATGTVALSGLPSSGTWTLTRNPGGSTTTGSGSTYTATEIPAGTWSFTVENQQGCISVSSASFTVNAQPPTPSVPTQTVDCSLGAGNAVITVTSPTGGGIEYSLNGGAFQTSNIYTGVANGTYTITVRNSSGCTSTGSSFSVSCGCAAIPSVTLSSTSGSTCGTSPITISGNTFTNATRVNITQDGAGTVNPTSSTTSPFSFTYTPAAADAGRTVTITITTDNPLGSPCSPATATYTLTVNTIPTAPVVSTITHPTCSVSTGSVVLSGLPAGSWTITRSPGGNTTTGSGTSATISGLAANTYTFTVTSAAGCVSPSSANVTINPQPPTPSAPEIGTTTQPTCAVSTGSVTLTGLPSSGTWTVTRSPGGTTTPGSGTSTTITAIPAGSYTFTVTNEFGCVSPPSASVTINTQPVTPSAPLVGTITPPSCGVPTGSVVLSGLPSGNWVLIRYPGADELNGSGSSTTIAGLPPGTYNYTVTNDQGCTSGLSSNVVITRALVVPEVPSVVSITQPACDVPTGSVVLSNLPSGNWTLTRSPDGVTRNGSGTTATLTGIPAGTYTFTVTNSDGCTSGATSDVVINTQPATPTPPVVGTVTQPTCSVSTGSVGFSGLPSTGTWILTRHPDGQTTTGTGTTRTVSGIPPGTYTFSVRNADGCTSSMSTSVTINPQPVTPSAPVIGDVTQPTCNVSTGSIELTGLPASGEWTLTRSPGSVTTSGFGSSVIISGLTANTYTFTVRNADGCTSASSASVTINAQPPTPAAPVVGTITQPTCTVGTGSVVLSGLPSGTWTLTRFPGLVYTTGSGSSTTITGLAPGEYNYTVTNQFGCESAASATVRINAQPPTPPAPVVSVDCSQGYGNAVVTVTSPTGTGYTYRLDGGSFQTSNIFTSVANGNHTVTVRNSSGCTTTGSTFSVNCGCVNPPAVTLSATSGSTCGTSPVTVSGNTFGGSATSVSITENGGGTVTPASSTASPFSFTYTPVAADAGKVITITVTTNNPAGFPCSEATATYSLTVNSVPAAPTVTDRTHPTCTVATGSVVLSGLPSTGEWTLTRSPGGNTYTGTGTSTTVTGLASGTYTFTVTNAFGCTSASSANVVINPQPPTPTPPVVGTITHPTCAVATGSVALSGLPSTGTWTITRSPGGAITTGTGTTRTITGLLPGTYTFTVTNSSGCTSASSAQAVINAQPVTPTAPLIGPITHPTCSDATGSLIVNGLPATGEWTLILYPGGALYNGTGTTTTVTSLTAGTYNFAVTNDQGCTSVASSNAVINPQPPTPTAPVVGTITHPTLTVLTGSVVLSGLPSSGTWTLTRQPDNVLLSGTGTTRTITGINPGTYTFTVMNSFGCTSLPSANVVINAIPGAPVLVINNPATVCSPETVDLTATAITEGSDEGLTFTYWSDADATIPYSTPETATEGTWYIMGTTTAGYSTIKPVVVTVDQRPVADAGPDQVLEYVFQATLNAVPVAGAAGVWTIETGTGIFGNETDPGTTVTDLSLGTNEFTWTITFGVCPPISDVVTIIVNDLVVPTLITPNIDGRNDYFVLRGLETLGKTELIIFDRRGAQVYMNSDYDNSWDGVDKNGKPLPDDTYFFVIRSANGKTINGYIVIRR